MDQLRARAYPGPAPGHRLPPPPGRRRRRPRQPPGVGRVRRPDHPDRPAGHPGRPGGPSRRAGRAGPGGPVAGPRPGRRRRGEPEDHLVPDRHRQPGPRRRPRLRPARTQEPRANAPDRDRRAGPGSRSLPPGRPEPGGCRTPGPGPDLIITIDPITTDPCDHRFEAKGHDPGVKLRHLAQIRHATCTSPVCRRPAAQCDFEHNTPYEAGGRTCLCNTGPKCRHDHRLKQHPRWKVDQLPDGTFRWTTPAGRSYDTEPTRYPI